MKQWRREKQKIRQKVMSEKDEKITSFSNDVDGF